MDDAPREREKGDFWSRLNTSPPVIARPLMIELAATSN
jgi:hypothetical protein